MSNPAHTPVKLQRGFFRRSSSNGGGPPNDGTGAAPATPSWKPVPPHSPLQQGGLRRGSMDKALTRRQDRNRNPNAEESLFTRQELEQMTIKELKQRLPAGDRYRAVDKNLVDHLIGSQAVELVHTFTLSALRSMSAVQLRRCLDDASVLYDARYVVEKEDMIRVFYASGKLRILPEKQDQAARE
ncbi:hypothetical protein ACA910_017302 [Epithemia clementina (nom. ined.)]